MAQRFCKSICTVSVYDALIMPHFNYCCEVKDSLGVLVERLQKHHNRCARVTMRYKNEAGKSELVLHHLGWSLLSEKRIHIKAGQMFKVLQELAPARLSNIFRDSCSDNNYHLRKADNNMAIPLPKTKFLKKSLSYHGAKIWNSFPN